MKFQFKKRSMTVLAGVLALALIGGVLAYYSNESTLENKLSTKMPGGEQLVEEFTPEDDWNPGEEIKKIASVENNGDMPLVVRVKLNEEWTVANGTTVSNDSYADSTAAGQADFVAGTGQKSATDGETVGDGSVVTKKITSTDWVYCAADGYWYYNAVLDATDTTSNFLESITLNATTDMGVKGTTKYYTKKTAPRPDDDEIGTDPDTEWVILTGDMPSGTTFSRSVSSLDAGYTGYAGSDYSLFITYETYQATTQAITKAINSGWDATLTPTV